ncbi:hypothetical protein DYI37_10420 [Fulvimarina endophytica]|uniref:Tetratricopeptide repeat protein n=1 Tax=Fulvimarina endophytica TaxID=2293836 RepID=A0A371X2K7_9HYPH|nr:hypothetical protein [Fulvimarina endophytica]RFC63443.1 hypothetical protein DYI37_10420 [Fulvimarina endophytica]
MLLRNTFWAGAGVGFAALLAVLVIAPGPFEAISMLDRDQRGEAAADLGNTIFSDGEGDVRFVEKLADLNRSFGDAKMQERAIDTLLDEDPDSELALRRAAEYLSHTQDIDAYIEILTRLADVTSKPKDVELLARTLRLWGEFDAEEEILASFVDVPLSPELSLRQAEILARADRGEDAYRVLSRTVVKNGPEKWATQSLLFDTMLDLGRTQEATRDAETWVRAGLSEERQADLATRLANQGLTEEAMALAGADRASGKLPQALAWSLGNQGHVDLAREAVHAWIDRVPEDKAIDGLRLYGRIAVSLNSMRPLYGDLYTLLSSDRPDDRRTGTDLASVVYGLQGFAAIAGIRHLLDAETVAKRPLFAASLAKADGRANAIRQYLQAVDIDHLTKDEAIEWRSLAEVSLTPSEIATILRQSFARNALPPPLVPVLRQAAEQAGFVDPIFDPRLRDERSRRS